MGSIPISGARANNNTVLVGGVQRFVVSMGDIETMAKKKTSLLRRIQARCKDVTVNH